MDLRAREVRRSLIERKINHPQGDFVDLSAMHIDDMDCDFIGRLLEQSPKVTSLSLKANRVSDQGFEVFVENRTLKELNASFNPLSNASAKRLYSKNFSLTEVDVTVTDINFNGLVKIEKMLARNRSIKEQGAGISIIDRIRYSFGRKGDTDRK